MKYQIGDQLIANGVRCEVLFINNDYVWLFPLKDEELAGGKKAYARCAYAKIHQNGKHTTGWTITDVVGDDRSLAV